MKQKTVAFISAEMMIPELGPYACSANQRGGLGDLAGHIPEGMVSKGIRVLPITYFYPVHWQTGTYVDYHGTPAHFLFNLDVDIHWKKRSVPIFSVDRAGAQTYGINDPEAGRLYPGNKIEKLRQSAFLGRTAHALLRKLEEKPDIVWCQEWMTVPVIPNLKSDPYFADTKYLFTLHTSMREALEVFPQDYYAEYALDYSYLPSFSPSGLLDPTLAGVTLADLVTAVSEEHGEVCRAMFPEYANKIIGLRNGTSNRFFISPRIKALSNLNGHPGQVAFWQAHKEDKRELIRIVQEDTAGALRDSEKLLICLYRRLAEYKNQMLFKDIIHAICAERHEVVNGRRGLGANVIMGGIAHENDKQCRAWMDEFQQWMDDPRLKGKFIYLPHYIERWRTLILRGCDIHVECPLPRCEACGTSPMVAKINGNPNIATKGGGIKEHGTAFDPETPEGENGDTLFIDPYSSETLYYKLQKAGMWYYDFIEGRNEIWLKLRMNNFLKGTEVDITKMIDKYDELCFERLMSGQLVA